MKYRQNRLDHQATLHHLHRNFAERTARCARLGFLSGAVSLASLFTTLRADHDAQEAPASVPIAASTSSTRHRRAHRPQNRGDPDDDDEADAPITRTRDDNYKDNKSDLDFSYDDFDSILDPPSPDFEPPASLESGLEIWAEAKRRNRRLVEALAPKYPGISFKLDDCVDLIDVSRTDRGGLCFIRPQRCGMRSLCHVCTLARRRSLQRTANIFVQYLKDPDLNLNSRFIFITLDARADWDRIGQALSRMQGRKAWRDNVHAAAIGRHLNSPTTAHAHLVIDCLPGFENNGLPELWADVCQRLDIAHPRAASFGQVRTMIGAIFYLQKPVKITAAEVDNLVETTAQLRGRHGFSFTGWFKPLWKQAKRAAARDEKPKLKGGPVRLYWNPILGKWEPVS